MEISALDARAEGCPAARSQDPVGWFREVWDHYYARGGLGWESNPWVWAIAFNILVPSPLGTPRGEGTGKDYVARTGVVSIAPVEVRRSVVWPKRKIRGHHGSVSTLTESLSQHEIVSDRPQQHFLLAASREDRA